MIMTTMTTIKKQTFQKSGLCGSNARIGEVFGSNVGRDISCSEIFGGFTRSLYAIPEYYLD
jgi:hypothetical protein